MAVKMLTNADIRKVDLVNAGAQQLSKISIMKGGNTPMNEKVNKLSDEELEKIQSLLDEIKSKLELCEETEEKEEDKVENEDSIDKVSGESKGVDNVKDTEKPEDKVVNEEGTEKGMYKSTETEEMKEALKKAADTQAENDKLKEQIQKMNDEKETKEFIQKASQFGNIPGIKTEELGSILKTINKSVDKDTYSKIEELLKSANDTIGTGSLFVEKGTSAQSSGDPTTADEAYQMIEKLAEQRVAKGISNTGNCISDVLNTPEGEALYYKYKTLRGGN